MFARDASGFTIWERVLRSFGSASALAVAVTTALTTLETAWSALTPYLYYACAPDILLDFVAACPVSAATDAVITQLANVECDLLQKLPAAVVCGARGTLLMTLLRGNRWEAAKCLLDTLADVPVPILCMYLRAHDAQRRRVLFAACDSSEVLPGALISSIVEVIARLPALEQSKLLLSVDSNVR